MLRQEDKVTDMAYFEYIHNYHFILIIILSGKPYCLIFYGEENPGS